MDHSNLPNHLIPSLQETYDRYIDHTMRGCTLVEAARRVGVASDNASRWVVVAEDDAYVIARRELLMGKLDPRKLWTPAAATLALMRIAGDEYEKASSRVAAIRELNSLMGYVTLPEDEKTRTRGHTMADFYRLTAEQSSKAH
jgi:hypothetical protein